MRNRFRQFLLCLLTKYWEGDQAITLGTEAFRWLEPYIDPAELDSSAKTDTRFTTIFHGRLPAVGGQGTERKDVLVDPLPHPSPLNRRWYSRFSEMMTNRLVEVRREASKFA